MKIRVAIAGMAVLGASGLLCMPAAAQPATGAGSPDYEGIVRTMRECARIEEIAARVSCYDNTVEAERLIAGAQAQSAPQQAAPVPASPAPSAQAVAQTPATASPAGAAAPAQAATGFGAEAVRESAPQQRVREQQEASEVQLAVRKADRLEPGIYRLTLEDGSQWRFVDAVPWSYNPPDAGSQVELARAALGSFQMRYASQRPVRIKRER